MKTIDNELERTLNLLSDRVYDLNRACRRGRNDDIKDLQDKLLAAVIEVLAAASYAGVIN